MIRIARRESWKGRFPLLLALGLIVSCADDCPDDDDDTTEEVPEVRDKEGTIEIVEILGGRKDVVGDYAQETDPDKAMRLFVDTKEDWAPPALPNSKDAQRVKVKVRIQPDALDTRNCYVHWTLTDPDDDADDALVDTNGNPNPDDNKGIVHEGVTHWFMQADHTLTDAANAGTGTIGRGDTEITKVGGQNISTVFFNFSDDGGDNFDLKATLMDTMGTPGKDDDREVSSDTSGRLTVWRFRLAIVHGMARNTNDTQILDPGKGQPNALCVTAVAGGPATVPGGDDQPNGGNIDTGANGVCETTAAGNDTQTRDVGKGEPNQPCIGDGGDGIDVVPHGDDRVVGNVLNTGADGICDTSATTWYPSANSQLSGVTAALRSGYANPDDDHRGFIDFSVSAGRFDLPYVALLKSNGTGAADNLNDWIRANFHGGGNGHTDYTFDIIGVRQAQSLSGGGLWATAVQRPHIVLSITDILSTQVAGDEDLGFNIVHELGHAVREDNVHDGHKVGALDPNCAFEGGHGRGHQVCEQHTRGVRDLSYREWPDHNPGLTVLPVGTADSN